MTNPPTPAGGYVVEGIEVVELSDVDLDFAVVKDAFQQTSPPTLEATTTEPAKPDDLSKVELFRGLGGQELGALAPQCQSIHAVPGYVLLAPGRLNTKVFFVVEGQLRVYAQTNDKRPIAIVDVGQSTGLRAALIAQPVNHSVIATEVSHVLAVDLAAFDETAKRSHAFARNYAAFVASYVRGDNCLHVGAQAVGTPARQGHVDELTLLHNQLWLDTVLPRLVARYRFGDKPLAVTAFAVDQLNEVIKEHGTGAGLRVLQAVGHWVLDKTRPTDLLAINRNRYIFAFLPDGDLDAARQLAARLHQAIATLSIPLGSSKAPAPLKVTLSLGVAGLEKGMKDGEFLTKTEMLINKSISRGGHQLSDTL